ncbi:MAG: ATP-binding protein [Bacteroidota bacterium]
MKIYVSLLLVLPLILFLLRRGNSQDLFTTKEDLRFEVDTNAILSNMWQKVEQSASLGNTAIADSLLKEYQPLLHRYGFRFENQFNDRKSHFDYQQLYHELYILEDISGKLTIQEILQSEKQFQFKPNKSDVNILQKGNSLHAMPTAYHPERIQWVKLYAVNTDTVDVVAHLMVGWNERSWKQIEVYQDDGKYVKKIGQSGLLLPLEQKMIQDWRNLIQLEVPAQQRYTYYFKLEGLFYPKYPDRIDFYHFNEKTYLRNKSIGLFKEGIFLGITFLLILFVGLIYYYSKAKDALFFCIQLIGIWLHNFADSENTGASNLFKEFFPMSLEVGDALAMVGLTMIFIGVPFFIISFLRSKQFAPQLSKWMIVNSYFTATLYFTLGSFNLLFHSFFDYPYPWVISGIYIFIISAIVSALLILVLIIFALYQKRPLAKMLLIAYSPFLLVILIFFGMEIFINDIDVLSTNQFQTAMKVTYLANYILFTIAIVYKRQLERKQIVEKRIVLGKQLYQEQAEAQRLKELDSFKSRLYTNLTHEFRTPLTIILGMVEQMRAAPKKYFDEGTQMIERNGKNLLRLINQLLDLSKLENKSFQLQLEQGDIVNYLRYLTESFQSYVNSHNLSIRFSSTVEEQFMDYDAEQTKQVMTNLISNAVKFTPSGGHIKVKLAKENQSLILTVEDTGIGIAAKELPHIFDRFYQVDDTSTRKGEGTGIGLAHTQELVRLMNGEIEVESQLNQGTVFKIRLPITQYRLKGNNPTAKVEMLSLPSSTKVEQLTIRNVGSSKAERPQLLIIEDNHDVVAYLKTCLQDQYQLDVAFNGAIGIEKALENIPDLIISDVMMPEKDGYAVCDTLKNDERTSHIPIILLTAKADASSRIVGLRRGADAYLSKPFDKEELLVRLEMQVKRQQKLAAYFSQKVQEEIMTATPQIEEEEEAIIIEDAFLKKVTKIIEKNYQNEAFGLPQLCQKIGMSRSQLFRKMKALINQPPSQFIRSFRLKKAKQLLESGEFNVNETTWKTGFSNPTHFSKIFKEEFRISPSELAK